jgi:hypothetical protein
MLALTIGYLGMGAVLLSLYLSREHYKLSQVSSFIGGVSLATSASLTGPIGNPFQVLNIIYSFIAVYNLIKLRGKKHARKKMS